MSIPAILPNRIPRLIRPPPRLHSLRMLLPQSLLIQRLRLPQQRFRFHSFVLQSLIDSSETILTIAFTLCHALATGLSALIRALEFRSSG